MPATIVNPQPKYSPTSLLHDPPPTGYVHVGATVVPRRARIPFVRRDARRDALLARLAPLADALRAEPAVERVTVYRAVVMPPPAALGPFASAAPQHDVAVLVEATDVAALRDVTAAGPYTALVDEARAGAHETSVMPAACARFVGDVDKDRAGLFLFNHFFASDRDAALEVWDHLAAWYAAETGLDNSTLLAPTGSDARVFVNHARWDASLARFALAQFGRRSFRDYVLANLRANGMGAMPILYRLAGR